MMLPQDALLLAATKLKTRRIRLVVTVIVAGLLFIILGTVSLVMNGAISSVESFSSEGLGKRYIVQLGSISQDEYKLQSDPEVVAEVKAKFETYKKDKVAAAKKLGASYDPVSEAVPIYLKSGQFGEDTVDIYSPITQQVLAVRTKEAAAKYYEQVSKAQNGYDIIAQHSSVSLGGFFGPQQNLTTISTIKDGKEGEQGQSDGNPYTTRGIEGVRNGVVAISDDVLKAFALENQKFNSEDGVVPIVAPYSATEEILGLKPLPTGSEASVRLERLKNVREQIAGKTFQVCLRNQASVDRQQTATQQKNELETNKNKKDYRKPDVVFAKSETPCQDVLTTRDVRTADQKKLEANQELFERQFGKQAPAQRLVTFRLVGITSDQPDFASFKITDLLGNLLTSYVGTGWFVPLSSSDLLPEYATDFAKTGTSTEYSVSTYLEFGSAEEARRFTNEKNCSPDFSAFATPDSQFASCDKNETPFFVNPFGSSSVALEELRSGFGKVFSKAMLIVALLSALIMMGTVGKIIADSRRETAVFRAIGAKRFDIAQIYLTYTLLLATILSVFTLAAGYLIASFVDGRYSSEFTVQSLVSFNASNFDKKFKLIGFDARQLGFLIVVIIAGCLLSALVPLFSNLRRNPIKDMRDER